VAVWLSLPLAPGGIHRCVNRSYEDVLVPRAFGQFAVSVWPLRYRRDQRLRSVALSAFNSGPGSLVGASGITRCRARRPGFGNEPDRRRRTALWRRREARWPRACTGS
jgi:hypothetical protein